MNLGVINFTLILLLYVIVILIISMMLLYSSYYFMNEHFNSYNELIDILKSLKNNNKNYMNYGYWDKKHMNIEDANIKLCDMIYEKIGDSKKILDVGCGFGEQDIYWYNKNNALDITAIDINESSIGYAKKTIDVNKIKFMVNSATNLKFNDNEFDCIISLESAFHYDKRVDFFKEAYRVLKPGGKLIMADLIYDDSDKLNIFKKISQKAFINFFNIPKSNNINISEYLNQLNDLRFETNIIDITNNTFKPYYKYFFNNLDSRNLLFNIYKYISKFYINNLCDGNTGFKYVITSCIKK